MSEIKFEITKKIGVLSKSAPALSLSKGLAGPRNSTWSQGTASIAAPALIPSDSMQSEFIC